MGGFGDCVDDPMRRIGDRNTDQFGVQGAHGLGGSKPTPRPLAVSEQIRSTELASSVFPPRDL